jgi:hypothetical protein
MRVALGMNGRNDATKGFVGFAPTMSGISLGGFLGSITGGAWFIA